MIKVGALDNVWAFVDGIVRDTTKPPRNQAAMYNGHKRKHALKYQSSNLFGPVKGKRQ